MNKKEGHFGLLLTSLVVKISMKRKWSLFVANFLKQKHLLARYLKENNPSIEGLFAMMYSFSAPAFSYDFFHEIEYLFESMFWSLAEAEEPDGEIREK